MSDMFQRNEEMNKDKPMSRMGRAAEARRDGVAQAYAQPPTVRESSGFRPCSFARHGKTSQDSPNPPPNVGHASGVQRLVFHEGQVYGEYNGGWYPLALEEKGRRKKNKIKKNKIEKKRKSEKKGRKKKTKRSSSEEESSSDEESSSEDNKGSLSDFLHEHCTKLVLKNMAAKAGLPQTGTKDELIERLTEHHDSPF